MKVIPKEMSMTLNTYNTTCQQKLSYHFNFDFAINEKFWINNSCCPSVNDIFRIHCFAFFMCIHYIYMFVHARLFM